MKKPTKRINGDIATTVQITFHLTFDDLTEIVAARLCRHAATWDLRHAPMPEVPALTKGALDREVRAFLWEDGLAAVGTVDLLEPWRDPYDDGKTTKWLAQIQRVARDTVLHHYPEFAPLP